MSGWLYLIRNRDLYKIGITKNFENRMRQLKPDNIVAKLYTNDFLKLERELHKRYTKYRIPQTEYFRLDDYHVKEIRQRIAKLDYPIILNYWIFIKSLLFTLLIFFLILIFISLSINDINFIVMKSILWMERILFGISLLSLSLNSGKYLGFMSELKYRLSRLFIFIFFSILFRIAYLFLQ